MMPARWLAALLMLLVAAAPARAVDVSELSDFTSDPCYMALSDRNVAQHVGAPDSALVDACERAHGSAEVAWDFLTRVWLPHDAATPVTFAPAAPLSALATAVALLEMLLAYAVLATPVWAVAAALRQAPARALAVQGALCVGVRLVLAAALLVLLRLPGLTLLGAAIVVAALAWRLRPGRARPTRAAAAAGSVALVLAGVINDSAAAAAGLLALALAARGHGWMLAVGVLLSAVFALPPMLRLLLAVRRSRFGLAACGAVMAFAVGVLGMADPAVGRVATAPVGYTIAAICAALVVWQARAGTRPRTSSAGKSPLEPSTGG